MVSRHVDNVDAYIAACPEAVRSDLEALRAAIRAAAPAAVETIRYGMPYYELNGMLCAFAAQKRALSFYLLDQAVFARFAPALPRSALGKGCVRFKRLADLPQSFLSDAVHAAAVKNALTYNDHC